MTFSIKQRDTKIQLDIACWDCSGIKGEKVCESCNGIGYIPTEVGEEILGFIRRHMPKNNL